MDVGVHSRISKLIRETVVMLCKNGVYFERKLIIQGLIGITADDGTVILVHMNECLDGRDAENKSSVGAPASISGLSEHRQVVQNQWPRMVEAESSQYAHVKQEADVNRAGSGLDREFSNTAEDFASSVQETEFETDANSFIYDYVDSTSDPTSAEGGVKCEASDTWNFNPYSAASEVNQPEYESTVPFYYSSRTANADKQMSLHSDPVSSKSELYGPMAVALPTFKPRGQMYRASQSARKTPSQNKLVARHAVPQSSWHAFEVGDAQPQFLSHQPAAFPHATVKRQPQPRPTKRPRQPKVSETTAASGEFGSTVDDDTPWDNSKWDTVTVTKFACKLCGQAFNQKPNLYRHQITAHGRQKKWTGARGRGASFM